jgi:cell wall-associated NlpC family hydrolase
MFESIVGAQEHTIKIRDTGSLIQQNRMARLTLADEGIDDLFFIVGVQRQGGPDGMTQIIRLREKGFAISDRVPDAPIITTAKDSSKNKSSASIAEAIATIGGGTIRWSDSFVRATNEFGVPAGWDFSLFLGVLLSICEKETHFQNIRQTPTSPTKSEHAGTEWYPQPKTQDLPTVYAQSPGGPVYSASPPSVAELVTQWRHTFANQQNNPLNPFYPGGEAGVGPMQLTTLGIKQDADGFGWSGAAKPGEYDGGRWNPDSNIRAAAKALADKGKVQPAVDPTNDSDIWIAVARYNGGGQQAQQYAAAVQAIYNVSYKKQIPSALAPLVGLAPGTTQTNVKMPDGSTLVLPDTTPPEARKAIAFCLARQGDPYQWAGNGPLYDCSSLVTAALNSAAGYLRAMLGSPGGGVKPLRETSYTLFTKGRFQAVTKDNLLPADLVFFTGSDGDENNPGHVGMYLNNGLFIQDPKTGDVVKISSLGEDYYRETYVGARRLVVWPTVGTAGVPH